MRAATQSRELTKSCGGGREDHATRRSLCHGLATRAKRARALLRRFCGTPQKEKEVVHWFRLLHEVHPSPTPVSYSILKRLRFAVLRSLYHRRTPVVLGERYRKMKFASALVGVGALCAGTDAFVPVAPVSGSFAVSKNLVVASSVSAVPTARAGDMVMMSLGGGGSKRGGISKSVSSKIVNIFRGSKGNKG